MSRGVQERIVQPGDDAYLERVWELKERIRRSDGVLKQNRGYFEREYRQQTAYLLLSGDDSNEVVAFAVIHSDGYLSLFGVARGHRRQGVGTALVESLLEDYPTVTCHTRASNQSAVAFCEHVGFDVVRRIVNYYPDGTDALFLRLARD